MDFQGTRRVLEALEREEVRYVVFGAAAMNFLGLPRATQDLDIFVEPDAGNIERLKTACARSIPIRTSTRSFLRS